jgi:tRNA pseudouridine32 synthase/23S rRNA pseudouridine746 synthase
MGVEIQVKKGRARHATRRAARHATVPPRAGARSGRESGAIRYEEKGARRAATSGHGESERVNRVAQRSARGATGSRAQACEATRADRKAMDAVIMALSCGGLKKARTLREDERPVKPRHGARLVAIDPVDELRRYADAVDVIHADTALIVVVKPEGTLAVPGPDPVRASVAVQVQQRFADALVVHRLDLATSGLMLFARGVRAHAVLSAAFRERRVGKRYEACVEGEMPAEHGEIDLPLAADWPNRPRQRVDHERGRPSLTRWRVLACSRGRTRLQLEPLTGRTHQLRVHLWATGHAIVGDALYGTAGDRLLLHATALALEHPVSGEALRFSSPAPF